MELAGVEAHRAGLPAPVRLLAPASPSGDDDDDDGQIGGESMSVARKVKGTNFKKANRRSSSEIDDEDEDTERVAKSPEEESLPVRHEQIANLVGTVLGHVQQLTSKVLGETKVLVASVNEALVKAGVMQDRLSKLTAQLGTSFEKAGKMRTLAPGEVLVEKGKPTSSLYLLVEGSLRVTKVVHGKERQLGEIKPGTTIGELTFILDSTPVVSVSAPSDAVGPVTVGEITHHALSEIIANDEKEGARFLEALAASIAKHLHDTSASMVGMLDTDDSDEATAAGTGKKGAQGSKKIDARQVLSVTRAFGLSSAEHPLSESEAAKMLLAHRECQISVEEGSLTDAAQAAHVYLFASHLCIERERIPFLSFFNQRSTIALREVLGVVFTDDDFTDKKVKAGGSQLREKAHTRVGKTVFRSDKHELKFVDIQMAGSSVTIAMEVGACLSFVRGLEKARLRAMDTSSFSTKREADRMTRATRVSLQRVLKDADQKDEAAGGGGSPSSQGTAADGWSPSSSPDASFKSGRFAARQPSTDVYNTSFKSSFRKGGSPSARSSAAAANDNVMWVDKIAIDQLRAGDKGLPSLGRLSDDAWDELYAEAVVIKIRENEVVIDPEDADLHVDGLMQVVFGSVRVELDVPGRPHALVVGRNTAGDVIGVASLLLGTAPGARVVGDSEESTILWLPSYHMEEIFQNEPLIASNVYYLLARRQALKLHAITESLSTSELEVKLNEDTTAPKTIKELAANEAYFRVFHNSVQVRPDAKRFEPLLKLLQQLRQLARESDPAVAATQARSMKARFIEKGAESDIFGVIAEGEEEAAKANKRGIVLKKVDDALNMTEANLYGDLSEKSLGGSPLGASMLRHAFDMLIEPIHASLEKHCLDDFLNSIHFEYVLELKMKECRTLSLDHFRVMRPLGQGAFGQVFEVVKRDCGKHYAMKVVKKATALEAFGEDDWEEVALAERKAMSFLHSPLLINLAYAFQNEAFLFTVADVCYGGDLDDFGIEGKLKLTPEQLRFVSVETVCLLEYVHSQNMLHRDLKPANLLLDEGGHVRLIDFGVCKHEKGAIPWSDVYCGTLPYMAPEVYQGKRYAFSCDWFSLGVTLYELAEKAYPYGKEPEYEDVQAEFVEPSLLGEDGETEIPHLYDLLASLLDWNPNERLGVQGGVRKLKKDPYWHDVDWELAALRRLPSPLQPMVKKRIRQRHENWKQELNNNPDHLSQVKAELAEMNDAQKKSDETVADTVDDWEFTSEHAIASEYVTSSKMVSIV